MSAICLVFLEAGWYAYCVLAVGLVSFTLSARYAFDPRRERLFAIAGYGALTACTSVSGFLWSLRPEFCLIRSADPAMNCQAMLDGVLRCSSIILIGLWVVMLDIIVVMLGRHGAARWIRTVISRA